MVNLIHILDTYAWVEHFLGTEKGKKVRAIIQNKNHALVTLESSLAELREWSAREGFDFDRLLAIVRSRSTITPIDLQTWLMAADSKQQRKKRSRDFGLIDGLVLAKQNQLKCKVVTGDPHFRNLRDVVFLD